MADSPDTTTPSRRYALGLLAGMTALAGAPSTAANANAHDAPGDAELVALDVEIRRLSEKADAIVRERIWPVGKAARELLAKTHGLTPLERIRVLRRFDIEHGVADAGRERDELLERIKPLFERMRSLPAQTNVGRAAKVRTYLVNVLGDEWRGETVDNWAYDETRMLLGEFAGMTSEELAAI